MFRLVGIEEDENQNPVNLELAKYISSKVSAMITAVLDDVYKDSADSTSSDVLQDSARIGDSSDQSDGQSSGGEILLPPSGFTFDFVYDEYFSHMFEGISAYLDAEKVTEKVAGEKAEKQLTDDNLIGRHIVRRKLERMKEKLADPDKFYTFDIFEERLLWMALTFRRDMSRSQKVREANKALNPVIEEAEQTLRKKYGFTAAVAEETARKMYRADSMLLKGDEDDNLIFWDDDYIYFFQGSTGGSGGGTYGVTFAALIKRLISYSGYARGYGWDYAREIFTDIGIEPPLLLLGTEEANKLALKSAENEMREGDKFWSDFMDDRVNTFVVR